LRPGEALDLPSSGKSCPPVTSISGSSWFPRASTVFRKYSRVHRKNPIPPPINDPSSNARLPVRHGSRSVPVNQSATALFISPQTGQLTHDREYARSAHTCSKLLHIDPRWTTPLQHILDPHPDQRSHSKLCGILTPGLESRSHTSVIFGFIVEIPSSDSFWWPMCILGQKTE
jgi:hypothetical protein